nr:probable E3 ubiquitin-protein ligase RHG1A [Ipomoea batatas]
MQGQKSAIGSLPETLGFNHGSTSADAGIEPQICWNNLRNSTQNLIPDYMVSSNETASGYIGSASQERQNLNGWSLGESSSSIGQNQVSENDPKPEHHWPSPMSAFPGPPRIPEERRYGPSNILSLNNAEVNINSNHTTGTGLFMQGSSSRTSPHNLNRNSGFEGDDTDDDDDDDCLVMECVTAYKSEVPVNERVPSGSTSLIPFAGPTGTGGYLAPESDGRPGSSLDGRRISCKRKALEGHVGQSSGNGSSSYFHHAESSVWHTVPAQHNVSSSSVMSSPAQNYNGVSLPEPINPRLGLSIGSAAPEGPLGLTSSRNAESSRRNFRVRINTSQQQDSSPQNLFSSNADVVNATISSDRHSSRLLNNNSLNLQPPTVTYNANPQGSVRVPALRPSAQARWNAASSSRSGNPASFPLPGERDFILFDEPSSRGVPRNMSQHPMFTPASEMGNPTQNPPNWGLANGNISIAGNAASTSRGASSSGAPNASPSWAPHRNPPQYPRRLSEFVRRSLLSSVASDSGVTGNNPPPLSGSSATSQEIALPANNGHRPSSSRSAMLLERHLAGSSGGPYSWRGLAAAGEGRSRLVSEIRNVLDLMRRGENLRIEDVMILDQSILFGMADIHDRHRDMRLDVDNMSYEELLALEERIGNVCTGLSEEAITSRLKQHKYASMKTEESMEREPCCVCQEEYNDGDDLGALDCGHEFHNECIKQWLKHKNLCPICKTTGLAT